MKLTDIDFYLRVTDCDLIMDKLSKEELIILLKKQYDYIKYLESKTPKKYHMFPEEKLNFEGFNYFYFSYMIEIIITKNLYKTCKKIYENHFEDINKLIDIEYKDQSFTHQSYFETFYKRIKTIKNNRIKKTKKSKLGLEKK